MPAIVDVFAHILTPRYLRERNARAGSRFGTQYAKYWQANPGLTDLDVRFRVMDQYPDVVQILTEAGPNIESITSPADAAECARIANDEMAELVAKHPARFVTACACLPMSDVDAALAEMERAITGLGFRGVEMFTDINGKPLDAPGIPAAIRTDAGASICRSSCIRAGPTPPQTMSARIDRSFSSTRISAGRSRRRWRWRDWRSAACSSAART